MSPSQRSKRADSRGINFGLGYALTRQVPSPIHPLALGIHHGLGEPASIGSNPGTNSGGGPSQPSLNDQWRDGQVFSHPITPLPGQVDHIGLHTPELPAFANRFHAPNYDISPGGNPSRGGIQGSHMAGYYSHESPQLLSRVEVHGNGLPVSDSTVTCRPVRARKVSHN